MPLNQTLEQQAIDAITDKGMTFGPYIVGSIFADAIMFGMMWGLFFYWWTYSRPSDNLRTKLLVYYLMGIGTIVTGFTVAYIMTIFVYGFGIYGNFLLMNWLSWFYIFTATHLVPCSVFYANRAYNLNGKPRAYPYIAGVLLTACCVAGIGAKVTAPFNILDSTLENDPIYYGFIFTWLLSGLSMDILNTATMMYGLIKSKTGWSQTDWIITKLVVLAAETQLAPTILMIGFLITDLTPNTNWWSGFFVCTLKTYILGVLHVLNSRFTLRRDMQSEGTARDNTFAFKSSRLVQATVLIETEVHVESHKNNIVEPRSLNRSSSIPQEPWTEVELSDSQGNRSGSVTNGSKASLVGNPQLEPETMII